MKRRRAGRQVIFGVTILTIVILILSGVVARLFFTLNEQENAMRDSVRDNAIWAAYKLDREILRFHQLIDLGLATGSPVPADEAGSRYDVLYSATSFITNGQYSLNFGADAKLSALADKVKHGILDLAPIFDALTGKPSLDLDTMRAMRPHLDDLSASGDELLLETNGRIAEVQVASREAALADYRMIAAAVLGLAVAFALMVALLAYQMRSLARAGREMEILTRRSADAAAAAEASSRAKSVFLATMSHEIRTPLNGIIGMVDLLEDSAMPADHRSKLKIVRQSGDLLLEVINDILDFSKLESGDIELETIRFNLADVLGAVRQVAEPRAAQKGIAVSFAAPPIALAADATRLKQVLLNLVSNAIKFTPAGGVSVVARLAGAAGDSRLRFEVTDTGIGIDAAAQQKLFQEFSQVDSSISRRYGGSGLGLAICRRLVLAMGGSIGVDSTPGQGSCFWFEIPAVETGPEQAAAVSSDKSARLPQHGRILLVEDNPTNMTVAGGLLRRLGMTVVEAHNGAEAIERIEAESFDAVLMDMQMPVLDGLSATRKLRAAGFRLPIIGLTANAFVSDREACLAAGMDDFLTKPVTRAKLVATLGNWLSERPAPALASASETPPARIDAEQRGALAAELGEDIYLELVSEFWTLALALLDRLDGVVDGTADTGWDAVLHQIKGAAATLGFNELAETAERSRRTPPGRDGVDRLRRLLEATRDQHERPPTPKAA